MNFKGYIFLMFLVFFLNGCAYFKKPSSDYLDYQTKAQLIYPVKGESLVAHGGRTFDINHHAKNDTQRFAMDIVGVKPGSQRQLLRQLSEFRSSGADDEAFTGTYSGDKLVNENYYIFGREVVAPADGIIHSSIGYIKDNIPGEFNKKQAKGNYVIINHGNDEYSVMAHFKRYSLKVLDGQSVKAGDVIGLIGNSGNSSEPHLHYHLQTADGDGLPTPFTNYIANGELIKKGEPVRWDLISSP